MLTEILNFFFVFSATIISAYLIRHYIFTLTVLRHIKNRPSNITRYSAEYEPSVSILIPAHNEDKVIGKLLQKMTELSYPKDKMEVILIDDASSDNTGQIAEHYSKQYKFIKVLHRDKQVGGRGKAAALNAALQLATGEIV